jgi:hypothetical protein
MPDVHVSDTGDEVEAVQAAASLAAAHEAGEAGHKADVAQERAEAAEATAAAAVASADQASAAAAGSVSHEEARQIARAEVDSGMGRLAEILSSRESPEELGADSPPPPPEAPPADELPKSVEKATKKTRRRFADIWDGRAGE